jgi:hypothetical protein
MIYAIVIFLSVSGPVATVISDKPFTDVDACTGALQEQAPTISRAREEMGLVLGTHIVEVTCPHFQGHS